MHKVTRERKEDEKDDQASSGGILREGIKEKEDCESHRLGKGIPEIIVRSVLGFVGRRFFPFRLRNWI